MDLNSLNAFSTKLFIKILCRTNFLFVFKLNARLIDLQSVKKFKILLNIHFLTICQLNLTSLD